jgi:signal transduction histidine kinase
MSALAHGTRSSSPTPGGAGLDHEAALLECGRELAERLVAGRLSPAGAAARAASIAHDRGADRSSVALALMAHTVQSPVFLRHDPDQACRLALELLRELAPLERVSLWVLELGSVSCPLWFGSAQPSPQARAAARRLLDPVSRTPTGVHDETVTGLLTRAGQPLGVVVGRALPGGAAGAGAFVSLAADAIGLILERRELLGRGAEAERTLVAAHERRLTRLGFDLHDGPLQDVAVLSGDLRTARRRAEQELEPALAARVAGVFDDLIARVNELNAGLRTMARSLEGASVVRRPLAEVIRREIDQLEARTEISVDLESSGDLDSLSDSQQIALFRVVQEALTNVREHSGASSVRVALVTSSSGTTLEVVDDGEGFDPGTTLREAADRGRLGLLGATERIRLLGGSLSVISRPGAGTRLEATLPRWQAQPQAEPVPA